MISTDALQADVLDVRKKGTMRGYFFVKRAFDLLFAFIALVPFALLTIVVKIAYIATGDFHSIFYTQKRIGRNGKIFKIYKYRSMIYNAENELARLMKTNSKIHQEYTRYKKLKCDPRITKIGQFLRRYSLDEIPQILNIIVGDMSLVGNRPYLLTEKKDMGKYYQKIIQTKPGITGLWQVSCHNQMLFEERLRLESAYEQCFADDLNILANTIKTVICGGNN